VTDIEPISGPQTGGTSISISGQGSFIYLFIDLFIYLFY